MGRRRTSKKKNNKHSTGSRERDDDHGSGKRSRDVDLRPREKSSKQSLLDVSTDSDNSPRKKISPESSNVPFNEKLPASVSDPSKSTLNVNAEEFVPPQLRQHSHSNFGSNRDGTFHTNSNYSENRNRQQSDRYVGRGGNRNNTSRGRWGASRHNERRYPEKPENKDLVGDETIQDKQDDFLQKGVSDRKNEEKPFQTEHLDDNNEQKLLQMKELGQIPGSWDEETPDITTARVKNNEKTHDSVQKYGDDLEDQSQDSSVLESSNTSIQSVLSNYSDSTSKSVDKQNNFDMHYSNLEGRYRSTRSSYSSYSPYWKYTLKELFDTLTYYEDEELELFKNFYRSKNIKHEKVVEWDMDLFEMPEEYSLAHCVAADMRMGSGIAVTFRTTFKCHAELLNQRRTQGELAFLKVPTTVGSNRFIYYMVTKKESTGKPTYRMFWDSLKKMRDHIRENEVKKLAIPRLGCGLDRLDWKTVKQMIEYLFSMVDIEIVVCNFQQNEETSMQSPPRQGYGCKIIEETKSIFEAPAGSIIIYFTAESGEKTSIMKQFIEKYPCLKSNFERKTSMGRTNFFDNRTSKNSLCGCTVRASLKDEFCFIRFKQCLTEINKTNKRMYVRVFFQVTNDHADELLDKKILTLMKYNLFKAEIHVCLDQTESS